MKKLLLLATVVSFALFSCNKSTDTVDPNQAGTSLASTVPSNRIAVLEDFTGVRCGYCPDGHVRAKAIEDALPGKFIIIADHAGGYAAPMAAWANFTTAEGATVHDQANPAGYPAGTINRMSCMSLGVNAMDATRSNMTMDRGQWAAAANKVVTLTAPVNIGAKAVYNAKDKEIAITYDLYYTADETVPNSLNIAILQDNLYAKQSGGTPDPNHYAENHVLRALPMGAFGEVISTATTKGSKTKTKTYYYAVPDYYNGTDAVTGGGASVIADMSVVIFVTRGSKEIINALKIPIK
jgi:hypothetical protein